ncbi:MAG: aspartate-semialdehyde dehydrogenase [Erysipelotrichaceae bacterium]
MKTYNVAILGATGAVGSEMLKVLQERKFPIKELVLLASSRSAGKVVHAFKRDIVIQEVNENSFKGIDIVLSAVENETAKKWIPVAIKSGSIVVDNSSAYRMDDEVPLIIPEVNPEDIKKHTGIIANPNCATIIALVAVAPLQKIAPIKAMIVSTYQAVSGAGVQGIHELEEQVTAIADGKEVVIKNFQHQIAYNLIPQIGDFNEFGYSSEEMKMQNEGRKILHNDKLKVNCTCVRVPVIRSHSESITIEFENEIDVESARTILSKAPGIQVIDDGVHHQYPMPLDTSDQDDVFVGRIRQDISRDTPSLSLWCCGDQIRKGAATNAIQIAELLV